MRHHAFYAPDTVIQEEATRLLADVYASYELANYEIFDDKRDTFYEMHTQLGDRAERALVTLAALARVNDDGGFGFAVHEDERPEGVGTLTQKGKEVPLTAREACNKIIHAKFAKLELERSDSHPIHQQLLDRDFPGQRRNYLRPIMILAGDRANGTEWEAKLDIVQWVHAVLYYSTVYGLPLLVQKNGKDR
jgi:hypothetical protein